MLTSVIVNQIQILTNSQLSVKQYSGYSNERGKNQSIKLKTLRSKQYLANDINLDLQKKMIMRDLVMI